jgi:hypothetical protein
MYMKQISNKFQFRRSALRGDQRLQQIRRLPTGRPVRGQPVPELVERGLRRRSVEIRAVQLGCQASGQCQGSAKTGKGKIRQLKV